VEFRGQRSKTEPAGIASRNDRGVVVPARHTVFLRALRRLRKLEDAKRVSNLAEEYDLVVTTGDPLGPLWGGAPG